MPDLLMRGYADFSLCGRYRYRLTREWDEPYGPRNQSVIERAVQDAGVIVCAWGAHGRHLGTIRRCSGGSIDGAPR